MGALVVTLIAGVLFYFNVITPTVYLGTVLVTIAWFYIAAGLYLAFGFLKTFYHDFLGWHRPDNSPRWFDGLSDHSVCKYCGKDIMQDSQGNWFC